MTHRRASRRRDRQAVEQDAVVHGLAGSAAITLLVLAAIPDSSWAISYLLVFGLGTIAGMMVITMSLASTFKYAAGGHEPLAGPRPPGDGQPGQSVDGTLLRQGVEYGVGGGVVALAGVPEGARQLETAERWLGQHSTDATLLYALGRLCERERLWGKAQTYFEAALALEDGWRSHLALGELHGTLGRRDAANAHLAAALKLALAELARSYACSQSWERIMMTLRDRYASHIAATDREPAPIV